MNIMDELLQNILDSSQGKVHHRHRDRLQAHRAPVVRRPRDAIDPKRNRSSPKEVEMSTVQLDTGKAGQTPLTIEEPRGRKSEYPGTPTTCAGAQAVVHVEVHVAQAAGAYPITSSTTMGGGFNASVMNGGQNRWDE